MRKFLVILLLIFLGTTVVYGAPQHNKRKAKETKVCDPNDPTCFKNQVATVIDKSCGRGRPMRVAGMIGNAPFGWVEADEGTHQNMQSFGLGRVVLEKIAKELRIRFVSTGYASQEEALRALKRGEIDLLLAVYHRGDLGREVEIVPPAYFTNYFTVYFKKGNEMPVESYQDLAGLKGVVRKEEMIYPLIYQRLPRDVHIQEVLSAPKVFEMLMNGEADYILASPYALEGELRRYKMQDDIVSDGVVLGSATLFFAFSKNSSCYAIKDDFVSVLRQFGFSQKTLDKDIRQLIDDWGNRFRSNEVLMKTQNNTLPEDMEDKKEDPEAKEEE